VALATASTIPRTSRTPSAGASDAAQVPPVPAVGRASAAGPADDVREVVTPHTGSLARRMMLIAAGWITVLLLAGGVALDRTLTSLVSRQYDDQLEYLLTAMIASAEIDPLGEVRFNRPLADQRFLEPNSGLYWQISGRGFEDFPSGSLWDRTLLIRENLEAPDPVFYNSEQLPDEPLRLVQRTVRLPGSNTDWQFVVAGSSEERDGQIRRIRSILYWSFAVLGIGLFIMAVLQTWYGLGPLRRVRQAIARIRTAGTNRVTDPLPLEVRPLVDELNGLLAHSERQAEEARTHAGNLAHALKTPLTVVTNAASADTPELAATVLREAAVMRRQVDHHLARARAVGRRAIGLSRTNVFESAEGVQRAVARLYPQVRFDIAGSTQAEVAVERQDLDEILGNVIENAAKYGGGSVFVTVDADPSAPLCAVWVEDDGTGIPNSARSAIFARGARLDTEKPGTGLGLAIVRDVAGIYGGAVELGESEDLGGLLVIVSLPRNTAAKAAASGQ